MRRAPQVGRAFPGQGSELTPGPAGTGIRRNVRRVPAAGIRYQIPGGPDIDPPMPALLLRAPWRRPADATPLGPDSPLPGGITMVKKGSCCAR